MQENNTMNQVSEQELETYDNITDLLVKRFGIDKLRLIDEIGYIKSKNNSISDQDLLNEILKKFNIDIEKFSNELKEKNLDNKINKILEVGGDLTNDELERIEIVKQKSNLESLEIDKTRFSNLIEKAVTNGNFDNLLEFCENEENNFFFEELEVDKNIILNLIESEEFKNARKRRTRGSRTS